MTLILENDMKNANAFTQSDLERLGKVLSDKHGITLRIGGNKCSTDGNTITLPSLPPITEQRILSVIRCFLDHEVGHIIGKTDFLYASNFKQLHGEAAFQLLNSLEDVRCETLAAELRMGCGVNLDLGAKTIQDELDKAAASGDQSVMHPVKQACVAITYGGMGRPLPKYIDQKILDAIKPFEAKIASIGGWAKSTSDVADMIPGLMSAIKQSMAPEPPPPPMGGEGDEQSTEPQPKQENDDEEEKSESDSEESGESEDAEGQEDTEDGSEDADGDAEAADGDSDDGDDDADGDAGEGDSSSGDGEPDADESGEEDQQGDEEESDSNGDSDEDDGEGESDSDSGSSGVQPEGHDDAEASSSDGQESESDTQEQEPSTGTGGGAGTQAADIANIDLDSNLAPYAGTGEELAKEIEEEAHVIDTSDPIQSMRVYDPRLDQMHDIPATTIEQAMLLLQCSGRDYKNAIKTNPRKKHPANTTKDHGIHWENEMELDAAARTAAGPMRQRLLQILMSEAKVAWRGNLRRGSPDPRNLAALVMGTKDRVMRREKVDDAPDTACMMLMDLSGSMDRHDPSRPQAIDSAVLAAMSFASVLDSAGHACMVCGFQDVYNQSRMAPGYACNSHDIDDPWFTHNPQVRGRGINLWVAKKWTQKYASARKALASMLYMAAGGTPLAEGMAMAGRELVKRSETRKVMMVFTDGAAGFYYGQGLINKMGCDIYDATIKVVRNTDRQLTAAGVEVVYVGIGDNTVSQYSKKFTVVRDIKQLAKETMLELTKALHH